jgi:hypothetical protein
MKKLIFALKNSSLSILILTDAVIVLQIDIDIDFFRLQKRNVFERNKVVRKYSGF